MSDQKLKILVVDDTAIYRQMLRNVLRMIPEVEVCGAAKNGAEALEQVLLLDPDLITLDVQMPGMSGIEVLRELRLRKSRTRAIMVSSLTASGAQVTTDALLEGAFDFILKPSAPDPEANRQALLAALSEKLEVFRESRGTSSRVRRLPAAPSPEPAEGPRVHYEALVIGTSTGGPVALREVLPLLPADFPAPVFVVQHMPPRYTQSLAQRLDLLSQVRICEAADGMVAEPRRAYLAPGGQHMKLFPRAGAPMIRVTDDPPEHGCRPAVDYFLRSATQVFAGRAVAVILTGMGRDGVEGCRALRQRGGLVIAQHAAGCTVYGMPKAVADEGLADRVLPLEMVAAAVTKLFKPGRA